MHYVNRSILVPYSCERMYALVQDVARYPEFLPWCTASRVLSQDAPDVLQARIDLAYLGVRSHFATRNVHTFPSRIVLNFVDGPFRELRGEWSFLALRDDACKVTLDLHYSFAAGLLGKAIAPVFEHIANSLVEAFAARGRDLYGEVIDG